MPSLTVHGNYGKYRQVEISTKQIKLGNHTIDIAVSLYPYSNTTKKTILIPIKTRETEGGGHSNLFTRDVIAALHDLRKGDKSYCIVVIIVAQNWSRLELENIQDEIDQVFYFSMNPQNFVGFDEDSQIKLNNYIQSILNHE